MSLIPKNVQNLWELIIMMRKKNTIFKTIVFIFVPTCKRVHSIYKTIFCLIRNNLFLVNYKLQ